MVAVAFSFAASTPIQARVARSNSTSARSEDDARLVVSRAANFGTFQYLNLFVDGVHVAGLGAWSELRCAVAPRAACLVGKHDSTDLSAYTADSTTRYRGTRQDLRIYRVLEELLQGLPREERQHQENHHTEQPRLRGMRASVLVCY